MKDLCFPTEKLSFARDEVDSKETDGLLLFTENTLKYILQAVSAV